MDEQDFFLPPLHPLITLSSSPSREGELSWTLYHPITNQFFQIDWLTYECLVRFPRFQKAKDLISAVNHETTLHCSVGDLETIIRFLHQHRLLDEKLYAHQSPLVRGQNPFLLLLKNYLFFTIPLLSPQSFLKKTYPHLSILFHSFVIKSLLVFLGVMIVYTLPRVDEFLNSFGNIISVEGMVQVGLTFFFIKIIHEFAHAYTAARYGVAVPRMGIAFMVLYPVLYTETSQAWKLPSRRKRFHIAVAGITAELCLAGIFLLVWNFSASGSLIQTISFLVVSVSLIGSLLINLNPLMRFDGYYILSDLLGYENLQQRSCQFARWTLRRFLFGIDQPQPEEISQERKRFLIFFGFALIVYRFFLFLGIALLVYHIFFQPLGLFLMFVELGYFIFWPIFNELKEWYRLRAQILQSFRGKITICIFSFLLLYVFLPFQGRVDAPAVLHAQLSQNFYAPAQSRIEKIFVKNNDKIEKGDVLITLSSPDLDRRILLAQSELEKQEFLLQRRGFLNSDLLSQINEETVQQARVKLSGLIEQRNKLEIIAPISGVIRDIDFYLQPGQSVSQNTLLLSIIDPSHFVVTAYLSDSDQKRLIEKNIEGIFYFANNFEQIPIIFEILSPTSTQTISWRELSSIYGGVISSDPAVDGKSPYPIARQSFYEAMFLLPENYTYKIKEPLVQKGFVRLRVQRKSIFSLYFNDLVNILRQENLVP